MWFKKKKNVKKSVGTFLLCDFSFDTELTKYFQFIVPNREPFLDPLVQINNNAHLMKTIDPTQP